MQPFPPGNGTATAGGSPQGRLAEVTENKTIKTHSNMGLDIYAGTLTRYYTRNWKTVVQQFAEKNGMNCVVADSEGQELKPVEDSAEIKEICETMCAWRDSFAAAVEPHRSGPLWDEEHGGGYFTDKPNWGAYGALVMLQACRFMHRPLPEYVDVTWDAFQDPLVKEAAARAFPSTLLANVRIWIPAHDTFICDPATMPTGEEAAASTVEFLSRELDELNRERWQADEATIRSWKDEKFYVPVNHKKPPLLFGLFRTPVKGSKERYRTEDLAQCAFSMLWQAVQFATENRVPIILDF